MITLKMTGFPTIITYKVRAIGFKITSFIIAVTKLKNLFKRIISAYIAG